MAILAHHDDIEIGAIDGVLQTFQKPDKWFFGVVVTDGSGLRVGVGPKLPAHYTMKK